jgi:hypothetical protein
VDDESDERCKGSKTKTGARKLKREYLSKSLDQVVSEDKTVNIFEDTYKLPQPSPNGEIYVVGLAGEFCVKDTAIMLKKNFANSDVNVIQDLTRYVFVPAFLPFQRRPLLNPENTAPCTFDKLSFHGEWLKEKEGAAEANEGAPNDAEKKEDVPKKYTLSKAVFAPIENKSLSLYMFEYNPVEPTQTKRLELTDLIKYEGQDISHNENETLFHFASDHRPLLKDYANFGVKLWMQSTPEQEEEFKPIEGLDQPKKFKRFRELTEEERLLTDQKPRKEYIEYGSNVFKRASPEPQTSVTPETPVTPKPLVVRKPINAPYIRSDQDNKVVPQNPQIKSFNLHPLPQLTPQKYLRPNESPG